ncbi:MAG: glycosyltransferase [Armatimonadota bacterium]
MLHFTSGKDRQSPTRGPGGRRSRKRREAAVERLLASQPPGGILLLYLPVGAGHRVAAEAIYQALQRKAPESPVLVAELADLAESQTIRWLPTAYGSIIAVAPVLYDYWWHKPRPPKVVEFAERLLSPKVLSELENKLTKISPSVIICTHALASRCIALLRERSLDAAHIAVATDFGLNTYWTTTGVDWYVVPAEELKAELAGRGFPPGKVQVLGIPTRQTDGESLPVAVPRDDERVTVLMVLGGSDRRLYAAEARRVFRALRRARRRGLNFSGIAVTGNNKWLRKRLEKRVARWTVSIRELGYEDDVPGLMRKADLLIAKPGGLTIAEALAAGIPMVLVGEPAGQERANVEFVTDHGCAIHAPTGRDLTRALMRLVRWPQRLKTMARHAREVGRPRAADDVAELALEAARRRAD